MLCSFITSQPQNDVSHTSLAWRRMWSDNIVTPFKGKTSGIVGVKCPYAVLSIKILALDPAGNSGRWRCMISPRWISTCLDLRLKWTPIGPKGSIKIRLSPQVINTVFNVFSLLFSSFVPPARIKKNPLQYVLQSTIWKGKCGWIFRLSCSFVFFFRRHIKTVWHFIMLHIWLVLSPYMHCLRVTKTLLSAYFYLIIYK